MKTRTVLAVFSVLSLCTGLVPCSQGQSTIAYSAGPASYAKESASPVFIDLDRDGSTDFVFVFEGWYCTASCPCYDCAWFVDVSSSGANSLLIREDSFASILSAGQWCGPPAPSSSTWSSTVASVVNYIEQRYCFDPNDCSGTNSFRGPLAEMYEGFIGVRFSGADGLHYGWIHVRLDSFLFVEDWAYETRPGVPIQAGAKPVPLPLHTAAIARRGYLRLGWPSEIGITYQAQEKGHLAAFPWSNVNFSILAIDTNTMLDCPMSDPAHFFRVVEAY